MTLAELRTFLTNLNLYDLDNVLADQTTGVTSAANLTAQLNAAAMTLGRRLYIYDPTITFTLTAGTSKYSMGSTSIFSKRVWDVTQVIINGYALKTRDKMAYGPWTMTELDEADSNWRAASNDVPGAWVKIPNNILLYPPPDAASAAATNYVSGLILPAALTTTTDDAKEYVDIPYHLHEAIAYLAAIKASEPVISEAAAWQRLASYNAELANDIKETARLNRNMISDFGTADWLGSIMTL